MIQETIQVTYSDGSIGYKQQIGLVSNVTTKNGELPIEETPVGRKKAQDLVHMAERAKGVRKKFKDKKQQRSQSSASVPIVLD